MTFSVLHSTFFWVISRLFANITKKKMLKRGRKTWVKRVGGKIYILSWPLARLWISTFGIGFSVSVSVSVSLFLSVSVSVCFFLSLSVSIQSIPNVVGKVGKVGNGKDTSSKPIPR